VVGNILAVETAERFSYFGFRAVLVLYFTRSLRFTETQAIAYYAYTTCWAYLSPLAGALLADGPWGRYATILRFGVLYVAGLLVLTIGASVPSRGDADEGGDPDSSNNQLWWRRSLSFAGLFLTCLGTGGIKPCVSAFGADQIALRRSGDHGNCAEDSDRSEEEDRDRDDDKAVQLQAFFAFFYVAINVGATTSIAVVPLIRKYLGFGPAFGMSLACMVTTLVLFWSRRRSYLHVARSASRNGDSARREAAARDTADGIERDADVGDVGPSSLAETFRLCGWLLHANVWYRLPETTRQRLPFLCPNSPAFLDDSTDTPGTITRGQHQLVSTVDKDNPADRVVTPQGERSDAHPQRQLQEHRQRKLRDAAQALYVLPVLGMLPVFWCLYDQQSSVWTLQATRMDTGGLQPEQLNVVNPVQIMILVPLFDRVIYPWLKDRRRAAVDLRPLRRMSWGMVLAAASFFASAAVERAIQLQRTVDADHGDDVTNRISVWWQLPQITILSLAEIFLSVTGLEFAYSNSPHHLKAFVMSLYLLTTALGNMLGGILYSSLFARVSLVSAMTTCGVLMLLNWLAFLRVSSWWEAHDASWFLLPVSDMALSAHHCDDDDEQQRCQGLGPASQGGSRLLA
jgi:dipeptide/tripeptide permease